MPYDDDKTPPGLTHAMWAAERDAEARRRHDEVIARVSEIARSAVLEYLQNCPQARDLREWLGKVEAKGDTRMTKLEEAVGEIKVTQAKQLGATKAYMRLLAGLTFVVAAGSLLVQWLKT